MTHRLATNYTKNYCNRTLSVKVIIENVVTCFLGTQCSLNKSTMQSLDFTLNRFFMKLFSTSNIVTYCQEFFGCDLPSVTLRKRYVKFIDTRLMIIVDIFILFS